MPEDEQNMADEEVLEIKGTKTEESKENSSEKTYTEEEFKNELNRVVGQEKARMERKYRKQSKSNSERLNKLESVLRSGLELTDDDDVLSKVTSFYKDQGIDIPEPEAIDKEDAEILGKSDALRFIDVADDKEIEARANELANKQNQGKTSVREDAEFFKLGEYLTSKLEEKELKDNGIDVNILKDKDFVEFANKFNRNTKKSEIYEMWKKMNGKEAKKPDSTGSTKSTTPDNQIKEHYTPEEVDKLSSKDLDNPAIFERVMKSMKRWK